MAVVGLDGKEVVGPHEPNLAVATLRQFLADVEDCGLVLESVYILANARDPDDNAKVIRMSRDSGLTVVEALGLLEIEKATILAMFLKED